MNNKKSFVSQFINLLIFFFTISYSFGGDWGNQDYLNQNIDQIQHYAPSPEDEKKSTLFFAKMNCFDRFGTMQNTTQSSKKYETCTENGDTELGPYKWNPRANDRQAIIGVNVFTFK